MILDNGVVRTLDPQLPTARALAIAGELIAGGVGVHETALASPEVVDLRGRCVLPGFNDAHVHFPTWASARRELQLGRARTRDEALALVEAAAREAGDGWLRGVGWRDADWSEPPTRAALDAATGSLPTLLASKDMHTLWVNSATGADTGEDGLLREHVAFRFHAEHGTPDAAETLEAMRVAQKQAAARGVTAIHDKDGWRDALPLWQALRAQTLVTLRVWLALPPERLDELEALGVRGGFGDDLLRIGYVKVFADGTLGSGTASMLDGSGTALVARDELEELVRRAARAGLPVAVHAIGDAANRLALDAFAATRAAWTGLRPRIEHAQCLAADDVPRFAELGVAASVQFSHAVSDRDVAERAWAERLDGAYAFRSLVDSGALVANGSDAPVEELDPWAGICAAVLRTDDERPPWRPEQALTLEQALAATCAAPAWLAGDERRRGRLLPGYLADLVVLDRDPFAVPADELPDVQIVATMVGGRWTHNPPPWE